jgi:hypothetical protein
MWAELPKELESVISRISGTKACLNSDMATHKNSTGVDSNTSFNEDNVLGWSGSSAQAHGSITPNSKYQLDVKYIRPILQLLLTRAEFNALKPWEEQEIAKITMFFNSYG